MAAKRGGIDLARARVLLVNDDGIHSPGLKVLEKVMRALAREVWVVAPETEQSAASHSLTLRVPLRVRKMSRWRYAVNGTPTDTVLLGVGEILKDKRPDLVMSGINRGQNMAEDITYSGTVAAAMEATLLGIPAIALSQLYTDPNPVKWATPEAWLPKVMKKLAVFRWPRDVLVNVNFPDVLAPSVTGIEVVRQGRRKIGLGDLVRGVDPRGIPYFWIANQPAQKKFRVGSDLEAVHRGAISITPLSLDLTHASTLRSLKRSLK